MTWKGSETFWKESIFIFDVYQPTYDFTIDI